MRIIGKFSKEVEPLIDVVVSIPSIKSKRTISFLIDTGASHSSISQKDAKGLGINIDKLSRHSVNVRGVGGEASTYVLEEIFFVFRTKNDNFVHYLHKIFINKSMAPSILGMDFLTKFDLYLSWKKDLIVITDEEDLLKCSA